MGSTEQGAADESSTSMPVLPITSRQTLAACRAMPLQPGDVFIASYPKSGTTWMQNILTTLLLGGALNSPTHPPHLFPLVPFLLPWGRLVGLLDDELLSAALGAPVGAACR